MTHYHRIIEGPSLVEHKGERVECFTILPVDDGIEERNAPVLMTEHDLTDEQKLRITMMMSPIDIHFDGKTYEYRTQIQTKDENGDLARIVVETEMGY